MGRRATLRADDEPRVPAVEAAVVTALVNAVEQPAAMKAAEAAYRQESTTYRADVARKQIALIERPWGC